MSVIVNNDYDLYKRRQFCVALPNIVAVIQNPRGKSHPTVYELLFLKLSN